MYFYFKRYLRSATEQRDVGAIALRKSFPLTPVSFLIPTSRLTLFNVTLGHLKKKMCLAMRCLVLLNIDVNHNLVF